MRMAFFTGMRRGELFKLKWDDIDFERGFIRIRQPKGGIDQTIPMNRAAHDLLQNHPRNDSSPDVFPGRSGRQRTRPPKRIEAIRERAGLQKTFGPYTVSDILLLLCWPQVARLTFTPCKNC